MTNISIFFRINSIDKHFSDPYLEIMNKDRPIKIKKGAGLALYCEADGERKRMLQWYKRTAEIDEELSYVGNRDVVIANVTKSDSGMYVCKMHHTNSGKILVEKTVEVVVSGESND